MADKKKILILYASAGHGHEKAAKAVEAACRADDRCETLCVDTLTKTSGGFGKRYRNFYLFMIRSIPGVWGFFYYLTDWEWVYGFVRPLRRLTNAFFAGGVEKTVLETAPDIVISAHFMACEIVSHLKKKGRVTCRLVTVVTDYRPHTFWLTPETDAYSVAVDETAEELVRRGVPREKIRVTGIPIEPKFSASLSRSAARATLGLPEGAFTVLLTSGGGGVGLIEPLVDRLVISEPPIHLLVICGTNEAMRRRLAAKYPDRTGARFFGFVDNVHELMAASDVVVGKGGLTITESLMMAKPMVLFGAVPGQETRNVEIIVRKNAAKLARSLPEAVSWVKEFQKDQGLYRETMRAIESLRRLDAARSVLKLALGD